MEEKYQHFTLPLALFDFLPVILFTLDAILMGVKMNSILFIVGSCISFLAGFLKALWKTILVCSNHDYRWMGLQLRIGMPVGFILMIIGLIINCQQIDFSYLKSVIFIFPNMLFLSLYILGMITMMIFGFTLDSKKAKSNWLEEICNVLSQICLLIFLLII